MEFKSVAAKSDIFALSYVTGRSVGIGAYLCRLGQRTIQMKTGPMILTGYSALNKLLGRQVKPQPPHPRSVLRNPSWLLFTPFPRG